MILTKAKYNSIYNNSVTIEPARKSKALTVPLI